MTIISKLFFKLLKETPRNLIVYVQMLSMLLLFTLKMRRDLFCRMKICMKSKDIKSEIIKWKLEDSAGWKYENPIFCV